MARRLKQIGLQFEGFLTSPLLRARQTANILHDVGLGDRPVIMSALAPAGSFREGLEYLTEWQRKYQGKDDARLVMVGHQPDLGNWAERLLWREIGDRLTLKKAGIIGIRLDQLQRPNPHHELFLLISPKWLI